eukprot:7679459-Alexandrium_andersonii.AAC.1
MSWNAERSRWTNLFTQQCPRVSGCERKLLKEDRQTAQPASFETQCPSHSPHAHVFWDGVHDK